MSTVKFKQGESPPISKKRKAALKAMAESSDRGIDYSDIPPLSDEVWKFAMRNPFCQTTGLGRGKKGEE